MSVSIEELKRKMEEKRRQLAAPSACPASATASGRVSPNVSQELAPPQTADVPLPSSTPPPAPRTAPQPLAASVATQPQPLQPAEPVAITVAPPAEFASPATAVLNYHSKSTTTPATTAAVFVQQLISNNTQLHTVARRYIRRLEEAERMNDISKSRKRPRNQKDDDGAVETAPPSCSPSAAVVGSLQHTSSSAPCHTVDEYENKGRLSEGVYGIVFKAVRSNASPSSAESGPATRTSSRSSYFALKQIKGQWLAESQVGFPPYLLRELELTMRLNHPNIVRTLEVVYRADNDDTRVVAAAAAASSPQASPPFLTVDKCSVYAVMEFAWRDLKQYLYETKTPFVHLSKRNVHPGAHVAYVSRIKCIAKQLFEGLAFMHRHRILHRDLKTSNILITADGTVQIADFGLSRFTRRLESLTPTVVTLMYRAPELHFGITDYDDALDVWSAGCILAELFLKYPLFRGENEAEHCARVCQVMGYPTNDTFEGIFHRSDAVKVLTQCLATVPLSSTHGDGDGAAASSKLRSFLQSNPETSYRGASAIPPSGVDLLCSIFQWNPRLRPSADAVLKHPFFTEELPLPADKSELLKPMPFALQTATKAPSPSLCHSSSSAGDTATATVTLTGQTALDPTVRMSLGNSSAVAPSPGLPDDDDEEERARLEDELEQEAQAQNVRGTSPAAAAHMRKLAMDDEANSRIPTPVLVPGGDEEQP